METKIKQLAQENSLTRAFNAIRNNLILHIDKSITTSESEDELREREM